VAGAATPCSPVQPQLSATSLHVYWGSFADYSDGLLSVGLQFSSSESNAYGTTIISAENSNGVSLATDTPVALGDIEAGGNASVTLKYQVPSGIEQFRTLLNLTANDDCGNSYSYTANTDSIQTAAHYSMSTFDNGRGQVTVNITWDPESDHDHDAVATVKYRLYPTYPQDGGLPGFTTTTSLTHRRDIDSVTINSLLPGRFYDFLVEVSDNDGVEGSWAQSETPKLLRDDRFALTNIVNNPQPGVFDEVIVRDYYNGALFWYSSMNIWEFGNSYEYTLRNGVNSVYSVITGKAAWQSVVDRTNHKIYLAGEMPRPEGDHHYRAMIGVVNEDDPFPHLSTNLVPGTDDSNELIGITMDTAGNRLLAGERLNGTPLNSSAWPHGGGLWSVPINTIDQPSTYARIYQDPLNRTWDKLTVFNGRLYAIMHNGGYGVLMSAALADVPATGQMQADAWRIELPPMIASLINSPYHGLVVSRDSLGHFLTLQINDGSGWKTIDTNYAYAGVLYELPDHRFLVTRDYGGNYHLVGVAGVEGDWEYLGVYPGGWPSFNYATDNDSNIFYSTVTPGKIWKVSYTP